MKTWKRVLTVLLTAALVAGMGLTAFAADTYSITLENAEPGNKRYRVYQIFTGDVEGDTLTNIQWGNGVNYTNQGLLYAHYGLEGADRTAAKVAAALATYNVDDKDAATAADARAIDLANTLVLPDSAYPEYWSYLTYNEENKTATISGLAPGYYMIYDSNKNSRGPVSRRMVQVLGKDIVIENKVTKPAIDKKIVENGVESTYANTAIGDLVDFKITSSVPNCEGYTKYILRFEDTLSKGLYYRDDLVVKIGDRELTPSKEAEGGEPAVEGDYTVTIGDYDQVNGTSINIEMVILDEKDETHKQKYDFGQPITITYKGELNENAKVSYVKEINGGKNDSNPNPNTVHLVYSNDPNDKDSTAKTPDVTVTVYTAAIQIVKTTDLEHGYKMLDGAQFRIYADPECTKEIEVIKTDSEHTTVQYRKQDSVGVPADKAVKSPIYRVITPEEKEAGATGVVIDAGHPVIVGLKSGQTYYIKETKAPDGFKMMDPNPAAYEVRNSGSYGSLASFIIGDSSFSGSKWATIPVKDWAKKGSEGGIHENVWDGAEPDDFDGRLEVIEIGDYSTGGFHVIDKAGGSVLPDTGGIGTTIFYVIGAVLVIGAGVILVTRRRMDSSK